MRKGKLPNSSRAAIKLSTRSPGAADLRRFSRREAGRHRFGPISIVRKILNRSCALSTDARLQPMSHKIEKNLKDRLKVLIPFGLGQTKPRHFRDMARVAWKNRDNIGYAWKVLSKGVCDGCALGVAGFRDWTIQGVHLCMTRLNLLRLNTMPVLDLELLEDLDKLRSALPRRDGRMPSGVSGM